MLCTNIAYKKHCCVCVCVCVIISMVLHGCFLLSLVVFVALFAVFVIIFTVILVVFVRANFVINLVVLVDDVVLVAVLLSFGSV